MNTNTLNTSTDNAVDANRIVHFGPSERAFVYAIARRYVRDEQDAHDVAQEAMLLAYRYRESFRGDSQYRTWLYRIASTTALSFLRSARRRALRCKNASPSDVEDAAFGAAATLPDSSLSSKEEVASLLARVDELAPAYREVVALRCEEMSEVEVARALGLTVSTVKIRAHRARKMLRAMAA